MPIVAEQMTAKGLIENGIQSGFRAASYDLHVGAILEAPKEDKRSSGSAAEDIRVSTGFSLRPQGMVRVISRERVKLPENIVGYALTKNGLSNQGILAINIGIIDPGYEGPISSTLINFGNRTYQITPETSFLRLTFHEINETSQVRPVSHTHSTYLEKTKLDVLGSSGPKFLNLSEVAQEAGQEAFGKFKNWLFLSLPLAALALALITLFIPWWAQIWTGWNTYLGAGPRAYENRLEAIESKIGDIEERLNPAEGNQTTQQEQ